jgi:hypothetical protein
VRSEVTDLDYGRPAVTPRPRPNLHFYDKPLFKAFVYADCLWVVIWANFILPKDVAVSFHDNPEAWINLMDLAAFAFVTPEILNDDSRTRGVAKQIKYWTFNFGVCLPSDTALTYLPRLILALALAGATVMRGLYYFGMLDPSSHPMLAAAVYSAFSLFSTIIVAVYTFGEFLLYNARYLFLIGAALFTIARCLAMLHAYMPESY